MANDLKRAHISAILGIQGGLCYLCEQQIHAGDATLDHIWPKSNMGIDMLPNLAVAHMRCNSAKGSRLPTIEELLLGELIAMVLIDVFPINDRVRRQRRHGRPKKWGHTKWYEGNPVFETALAVALKEAGLG